MAAAAIDVRKKRGIVERRFIFERGKFHRQTVFSLGEFFRDEPPDHRDMPPDMRGHVYTEDGPKVCKLRMIETEWVTADDESKGLGFVRDLLSRVIIFGNRKAGDRFLSGKDAPEEGRAGEFACDHIATTGFDERSGLRRLRLNACEKILKRLKGTMVGPFGDGAFTQCVGNRLDLHEPHANRVSRAGVGPVAEVHIRRQHGQTHPTRFRDIGKGRIKSALIADDRGKKLGRIVDAQIGAFKRHLRIAGGVRFQKL